MKTVAPQSFETLEDRRLFSVADFTIDPGASRISVSGTIDNKPVLEQSAGSLTAWLTGNIKADVTPQSIRLTGGSTIAPVEQYWNARPFGTTASLAGKVLDVNVLGTRTNAFFAMRGATFDVVSPTLPVVNGDFASALVDTLGTAGTLDFEAVGVTTGSVDLAQRSIVSPTVVPSSLTSVRGQARLTLRVNFTIEQDVPGNGSAVINVAGWVVAAAHRLGGVAGNIYHDVNDNDLKDDGAASVPTGAFTVYADLDKDGLFDPGEPSATPDASGNYQIEYVPYGDQTIRLQAPFGYRHSLPSTGRLEVNVQGNGNRTGQDFMVTRKSLISGVAWADADQDGNVDANESRWAGRRVFSDLDNNGLYTAGEPSTTTNAKGAYTLRNLTFGTHRIRVEVPKGNVIATPAAGYATVNIFGATGIQNVNLGSWLGTAPIFSPAESVLK